MREAVAVERVEWDTFVRDHFRWVQGEHVTMVGPTGSGKTTLALALLPMRKYVVALATKPRDETMSKLVKMPTWKRIRAWSDIPRIWGSGPKRYVLWPRFERPSDIANQREAIAEAFSEGFTQGNWCFFVDEISWIKDELGLEQMLRHYWQQGRALRISLIAGTQRPAFIPLLAYDQATHVFFWRDNDERNLKRVSGLNGLNARTIHETIATLPRHDVLYVNTRTGKMLVTRAPE